MSNTPTPSTEPACTAALISVMLDDSVASKARVAANPSCPPEVLQQLAESSDPHILCCVAANPNCPSRLLEQLATASDESVRHAAVANSRCPPEVLERLADSDTVWIADRALKNPGCGPEMLARYARRPQRTFHASIVRNSACPPEVLAYLALNGSVQTKTAAAEHLNCPADVAAALSAELRTPQHAAQPPATANAHRRCLSASVLTPIRPVRQRTATNPACPPLMLATLTTDPDPQVAAAARLCITKRALVLAPRRRR